MKRITKLSYIFVYWFAIFIVSGTWYANAEIGFDSDISTVNLAFSIFIGLILFVACYYICYLFRIRSFTSSVTTRHESPLDAFEKYWGSGSKWVSGIVSFIIGTLIATFTYWMLKGDFAI